MSELTALNEKLKAHCEEKDRKITSLTRQMDTLEGRLGETGHEVGRWEWAQKRAQCTESVCDAHVARACHVYKKFYCRLRLSEVFDLDLFPLDHIV